MGRGMGSRDDSSKDRRNTDNQREYREKEAKRKRTTQWSTDASGVRVGKKEILGGRKTAGDMAPNKSRYQGNSAAPQQSRKPTIIGGRRAAAGRPISTERKTLLGGG